MRSIIWDVFLGAAFFAIALPATAHETFIGQTANGQLALVVDEDLEVPIQLGISTFVGVPGYAADEPGLVSLDAPLDGLDPPNPLSDLELRFLSADPGMQMWREDGNAPLNPGDTLYLGLAPFHGHAIWNIFDGLEGQTYSLTFELRDRSQIAITSDPITLSFTPIPEPSTAGLLVIGGLGLARRRYPSGR